MRISILRLWLGAGTVGLATALGCSYNRACRNDCQTCRATPAPLKTVVVVPTIPAPVAKEVAIAEPPVKPVTWSLTGGDRKLPSRRTYGDITANAKFAHAPDYSWLVGELQYSTTDKAWVLHYAGLDQDDRYDGGVTLMSSRPMSEFHDGQLVRVEGQVISPESRTPRPAYRVHSIRPL